jgi:hypothetical protein
MHILTKFIDSNKKFHPNLLIQHNTLKPTNHKNFMNHTKIFKQKTPDQNLNQKQSNPNHNPLHKLSRDSAHTSGTHTLDKQPVTDAKWHH